ncbi:MAG: polysaccharide biosynthesis C-terminal domain-containing protein, partial [Nitrospinae bacterium]|nr:polysaccharide biosynthesis C-terminal domain-containing protein [Nitrospinota bacterium]
KEGAVSYLYYADRIVQFPLATFGIAFGTAILPSLSRLAAKNQLDEIRDTLSFGLRFTFFITIPAMVALAILAKPIITILFERGKFGAADSANTAGALVAYTIGLWAFSGIKILAPAYYSMKDTKTPVRIAIVAMLSNVVLNLILMRPLQHMGIALATSLSATINIALLIYYLEARVGRLDWHNVAVSLLRIIFAATIMGGACYLMLFTRDSYTMRMGQVLWLVMTMMIGLSTYLIASYLVKAEEMHFFIDVVVGRLKRKG